MSEDTKPEAEEIEWVAVAEAEDQAEADDLRAQLEAADIPAWIARKGISALLGFSMGFLGKIEVMVPAGRYDEAKELLSDADTVGDEVGEEAGENVELSEDVEWAVVARATGQIDAEIMLSSLETAGIPAWISRESTSTAIGLSVGMLGRIEIVVPVDRYDEATELLFGEYEFDSEDLLLGRPGEDEDKDE